MTAGFSEGSVPHANRAVNHSLTQLRLLQIIASLSIPGYQWDSSSREVWGVWPCVTSDQASKATFFCCFFFTDWNTKGVKAVLSHRCYKVCFLQYIKAMLFIYYFIYLGFFLSNPMTCGERESKVQKSGRGLVYISRTDRVTINLSLFQTQTCCFPWCIQYWP